MVDIGTNSMRLLITDGEADLKREAVVTGLGRGVDETGRLGDSEMDASVRALVGFGEAMNAAGVQQRAAVATSATRDSSNREQFILRATDALGVEPEVIDGSFEGRLAFEGAVSDMDGDRWLVCDIGGGSTEFVDANDSDSIDIGSIRLTDRVLSDRPPSKDQLTKAFDVVADLFSPIAFDPTQRLLGVAGTWTTLAAIVTGADDDEPGGVHHKEINRDTLEDLIEEMSTLTVEETIARFPAMNPARSDVILAGAVIASGVMSHLDVPSAMISGRDTLDGLARRLLALA